MKNKYFPYFILLALMSMTIFGCSNNSGNTTAKTPAIVVTTPAANEVLLGATPNYQITWSGTGITAQKTLEYSINNGANWILITTLNADVNSYSWSVLDIVTPQAIVRVTDKNGLTGSSGVFTISLPVGGMDASVSTTGTFKTTNALAKVSGTTVAIKASILQKNNINHDSISISLIISTQGTPPYTIDVSTDPSSLINYCMVSYPSGNCINFQAKKGVESGTINITSLSPNIEGTFSGTLPQSGGAGSVTITGGAFKALLP